MIVQTAYFDEIEIEASNIIHFEHGIPGFEDENQFILQSIEEEHGFQVLQSVQTASLAFIVTNPYAVMTGYTFELDEATCHALQLHDTKDLAVLAIVTLKETLAQSTVNLKAPIIMNLTNNKAKQVILNDDRYAIRHPLYLESKKG